MSGSAPSSNPRPANAPRRSRRYLPGAAPNTRRAADTAGSADTAGAGSADGTAPPEHDAHPLPAVDARLVAPETRYEIEDGRLLYVAAADEPHGSRHSKLSAVIEAHVKDEYDVASDMLTRLTEVDDLAPDVSVFPKARNPETGGRQLEELAFEVVNSQTLSDAGQRAQKLVARGVRRVFATDARRDRAFEWSADVGTWQALDPEGLIEDRVFATPLPTAAIIRTAKVDNSVARALLNKGNRVLRNALSAQHELSKAEGRAEGKAEGKTAGKAEALVAVLGGRGWSPTAAQRGRIARASAEQLDAWLGKVTSCRSIAELLRSKVSKER